MVQKSAVQLGDNRVIESPDRAILLSDLSLLSACQMLVLACHTGKKLAPSSTSKEEVALLLMLLKSPILKMVAGPVGFEPTASALEGRRSNPC